MYLVCPQREIGSTHFAGVAGTLRAGGSQQQQSARAVMILSNLAHLLREKPHARTRPHTHPLSTLPHGGWTGMGGREPTQLRKSQVFWPLQRPFPFAPSLSAPIEQVTRLSYRSYLAITSWLCWDQSCAFSTPLIHVYAALKANGAGHFGHLGRQAARA